MTWRRFLPAVAAVMFFVAATLAGGEGGGLMAGMGDDGEVFTLMSRRGASLIRFSDDQEWPFSSPAPALPPARALACLAVTSPRSAHIGTTHSQRSP